VAEASNQKTMLVRPRLPMSSIASEQAKAIQGNVEINPYRAVGGEARQGTHQRAGTLSSLTADRNGNGSVMATSSTQRASSRLYRPGDSLSVRPTEKISLPEIMQYNQVHNHKGGRAVDLQRHLQQQGARRSSMGKDAYDDATRQILAAWSREKQRNRQHGPSKNSFIF